MFDIPMEDIKTVQAVQEHAVDGATTFQATNGVSYHLTETDLSFSDALAGNCCGDASSGPVGRPSRQLTKPS